MSRRKSKDKEEDEEEEVTLNKLGAMMASLMGDLAEQRAATAAMSERLKLVETTPSAGVQKDSEAGTKEQGKLGGEAGGTSPQLAGRSGAQAFANLTAASAPGTPLLPPLQSLPGLLKPLYGEDEEDELDGQEGEGGVSMALPSHLNLGGQPYTEEWLWQVVIYRLLIFLARPLAARKDAIQSVAETDLTKAQVESLARLQWHSINLAAMLPRETRAALHRATSRQSTKQQVANDISNAFVLGEGRGMAWIPTSEAMMYKADQQLSLKTGAWTRAMTEVFSIYGKVVGIELLAWGSQYIKEILSHLDGSIWEVVQQGEHLVRRELGQRLRHLLTGLARPGTYVHPFSWKAVVTDTMNRHCGIWAASRRGTAAKQQ